MKCNVGSEERYLRFAAGMLAAGLGGLMPRGGLRTLLRFGGLMSMLSGVTRFCPANALLGIDNCAVADEAASSPGSAALPASRQEPPLGAEPPVNRIDPLIATSVR